MVVTLKNDLLTVDISSFGAELQTIRNSRTGEEFLWQGDPTFWGRRSPILFPIVGSVWDGEFRIEGSVYKMSQHGFARDREFSLLQSDSDSEVWFSLDSDDSTLAMFPYRFRLMIGYSLEGERVSVMWKVVNTDTQKIYFQIGAHPAFNYPDFNVADDVHGYFNLDGSDLHSQVIEEKGCIGAQERVVALDSDSMLALGRDTFSDDAIILARGQVRRVSLLDKHKRPCLTLLFNSPVVGLWSPTSGDAPFVCIEPWWGRADSVGFNGEFNQREFMNSLDQGQTFSAGYMIVVDKL